MEEGKDVNALIPLGRSCNKTVVVLLMILGWVLIFMFPSAEKDLVIQFNYKHLPNRLSSDCEAIGLR